ncbi:MAG: alanine racemase [Clostridia bacterium]|nr:alanine racemase [Clostridia bacterium]
MTEKPWRDSERTWIEIDADKLRANYRTAKNLCSSRVMAVLKANAYGHGAVEVARILSEEKCRHFAVSCAREALELRANHIIGDILVMGRAEKELIPELIRQDIIMTAASEEDFDEIQAATEKAHMCARAHLKLDTGFHRLGFACTEENILPLAMLIADHWSVHVEAMYSHLGLINRERDIEQFDRLMWMKAELESRYKVNLPTLHICDSIGLCRYPDWHLSYCRVGAFLYGVRPSGTKDMPFGCEETVTFMTHVAQIHRVQRGEPVGYSDDMVLERDSLIATLPAGYGDGYPRHLSNGRGQVLIRGRRAPVVGLVCMDQMMVDVTDIPECEAGDEVVLLGGGISYDEYADWCETNRNECISILSRRPVRLYIEKGQVRRREDSLLGDLQAKKPLEMDEHAFDEEEVASADPEEGESV